RALTRKLGEEGAHPPVRTLTIRSIGGADHEFRIRKVTAREKRFLPSIETVREGREYRLKLEMLPPPEDFTGRILRDTVTVETDDPLVPEIRLPGMAQI
ncbi:MAG: hypothetical protein JXA90_10170, partial [Planctomycetes bacterium]|nr:hypothetical protein [Planctomycetota bacterium]